MTDLHTLAGFVGLLIMWVLLACYAAWSRPKRKNRYRAGTLPPPSAVCRREFDWRSAERTR
jgi:hypothetical protein